MTRSHHIEMFILKNKDELLPEYEIINSLRRNERYQWDDIIVCCEALALEMIKKLKEEIEFEEQNITANMDAHKAYDLAKEAIDEHFKKLY